MTERGDRMAEGAAERLESAAESARSSDLVPDAAAAELRDAASFLRQLRPSAVRARLAGDTAGGTARPAPTGPQVRTGDEDTGGRSPLIVVAAAFTVGILLAKIVDWRGHAHPRR